ncbi:serpin family protein [Hymenobacter volaticus]|uniref:Serpin family protein n=1 Tax=Hymenobacter volaticus TaxID=2932254 RepID=A0ABY4G8D8_9BACT|nr:serpin family protein [Hymenobacter volaticus]UOQ67165.1 serpin family protein [Hymenobacter volaticus]
MQQITTRAIWRGVAGAALLLSACQKDSVTPDNTPNLRPLTAAEVKTVSSSNDFAFRSFSVLRSKDAASNLFISPLSISSAITMTYNGADGTTKQAIKETLGFAPQTDTEINESFKMLSELLTTIDKTVTFSTANSIWHNQMYQLQAPFVQKNETYFGATMKGLDFKSANAKDAINNWVKSKTNGKIESIVDNISADDVMYLVNAIYFKGTWTYQFDKKLTQRADFRKEDGSNVSTDFMTLSNGQYNYYADATKQVVDLPYGNKQFSMTLVLPVGSKTVADITPELNSTNLNTWLTSARSSSLELRLPKFKMQYEKELKQALTQLGMGIAFTNQANFSQMVQASNQQFAISEVKHKTYLDVNEEGTEAAAATSVGIITTSLPQAIIANRPFVFLIREKSSNAILFIGQLMAP